MKTINFNSIIKVKIIKHNGDLEIKLPNELFFSKQGNDFLYSIGLSDDNLNLLNENEINELFKHEDYEVSGDFCLTKTIKINKLFTLEELEKDIIICNSKLNKAVALYTQYEND